MSEWQPIESCPDKELVDLWCIYGDEDMATYPTGVVIGRLVSRRFKSKQYGWFGNQSDAGIPQRDGPDLVPVAWRPAVPDCPVEIVKLYTDKINAVTTT